MTHRFIKASLFLLVVFFGIIGCTNDLTDPDAKLPEFDETDYVTYTSGNIPLIISVPHGGTLKPIDILDRNCPNSVNVMDEFTIELAESIINEFVAKGYQPYIIINTLHRSKMDANRNRNEATCGDKNALKVWDYFHQKIMGSYTEVTTKFQKGLYLDLHGHGNPKQRVELGYLLYEDELALPPQTINSNSILEVSSIRNLAKTNLNNISHYNLLTGDYAFGTLLDTEGYNSVPSKNDSIPLASDNYFSGGYNTANYSSYNGGTIDGIQVECNRLNLRETSDSRKEFAKAFTQTVLTYLKQHYFEEIPVLN